MLLHRKGKLRIAKAKSRLSYSEVGGLPLKSILSKIYRYDADLSDYVVVLYFEFIEMHQVDIIVTSIPFKGMVANVLILTL
jgi:hypothetical protein